MPPGDTARLFHQLTSYTPGPDWKEVPVEHPLVLSGFRTIDTPTFTTPCKAYRAGLPAVELPREWPSPGVAATAALAGGELPAARLDLGALARVLFLAAGVVRTSD